MQMEKKRRGTRVLLILLVFCFLSACGSEDETEAGADGDGKGIVGEQNRDRKVDSAGNQIDGESWTICWYLCGSDLESNYSAGTNDLEELMRTELPDQVKVVIQTGGAKKWNNDFVQADKIQRFCYSGSELELVEEKEQANMGEAQTLADFLAFCKESYPADKMAVIFWNHGGGSVGGVAYDECYDYDSLSLNEIYQAFEQVYELSEENPPMELLGFDACLMASVDTAYMAVDIARCMVASEETEPGNGWEYSGWVQALADNPRMDGLELGRAICDSYVSGCEEAGTEEEITLSVIDLTKAMDLVQAYEEIGTEALRSACENPTFFAEFARRAQASENYGGNTRSTGFSNMVDLGDLVRNSTELLPETADLLQNALSACVAYRVNGPYRQHANGISCYYSYDGNIDRYLTFSEVTPSTSFDYFYRYGLGGELPQEAEEYLENLGYAEEDLKEVPTVKNLDLENFELYLDENGSAVLDLGSEIAQMLKSVGVELAYVDEDDDLMLYLGSDVNLNGDWETGVFSDNFWGTWGSIDGYLCEMEITYEGDDYNLYAVPILLNGEEYTLSVSYDYKKEAYEILGARKGLEENGMSDRNLIQLSTGDEITTIHYMATISEDDEFEAVPAETFLVTENTSFYDADLGDGVFVMTFELEDAQSQTFSSEMIRFTVENGEITTELLGADAQ